MDKFGDLFIADTGNHVIREVTPGADGLADGTIQTVAGNGQYSLASAGMLESPTGVAVDSSGDDLYIADPGTNVINKVVLGGTGAISTVAGTTNVQGFGGDRGLATAAELSNPTGVAVDAFGNIFIADSGNNRIREVTLATGDINTVAGGGARASAVTAIRPPRRPSC